MNSKTSIFIFMFAWACAPHVSIPARSFDPSIHPSACRAQRLKSLDAKATDELLNYLDFRTSTDIPFADSDLEDSITLRGNAALIDIASLIESDKRHVGWLFAFTLNSIAEHIHACFGDSPEYVRYLEARKQYELDNQSLEPKIDSPGLLDLKIADGTRWCPDIARRERSKRADCR